MNMKKFLIILVGAALVSGCSSKLFGKKEKLGCKGDGRNIGAERIASGDPKAIKASKKAKFRGPKTYNY